MTEKSKTPPAAGEQPERRQTPTERYHELALLSASRAPQAPEHTIGLTRNSRGVVQIDVAVRSSDLAELEQDVTATFDRLCRKYPFNEPASAAASKPA